MHNLSTNKYSLSDGLLNETGVAEISEQGEVSFRLKVIKDKEPIDSAFSRQAQSSSASTEDDIPF